MEEEEELPLPCAKGVTGKTQARTETRGSGKGEVKEMSTVCGGSWPRDGAIIKPQGQIILHHTRSGLPSLPPSDAHPLLFTFFFVVRPTYPSGHLVTHAHGRIRPTQPEEKAKISGVHTETQPADTSSTLSPPPEAPVSDLGENYLKAHRGGRAQQSGADLTTKASCYHFISGHGVLNLVFAPSKQLRDKSHIERGGWD